MIQTHGQFASREPVLPLLQHLCQFILAELQAFAVAADLEQFLFHGFDLRFKVDGIFCLRLVLGKQALQAPVSGLHGREFFAARRKDCFQGDFEQVVARSVAASIRALSGAPDSSPEGLNSELRKCSICQAEGECRGNQLA